MQIAGFRGFGVSGLQDSEFGLDASALSPLRDVPVGLRRLRAETAREGGGGTYFRWKNGFTLNGPHVRMHSVLLFI